MLFKWSLRLLRSSAALLFIGLVFFCLSLASFMVLTILTRFGHFVRRFMRQRQHGAKRLRANEDGERWAWAVGDRRDPELPARSPRVQPGCR
jgi:hypothetical protein